MQVCFFFSFKFVIPGFVLAASIISSHLITGLSITLVNNYHFCKGCCKCRSIPNIIFLTYMIFLAFASTLFYFWFELHFLSSNLHLHSHNTGVLKQRNISDKISKKTCIDNLKAFCKVFSLVRSVFEKFD